MTTLPFTNFSHQLTLDGITYDCHVEVEVSSKPCGERFEHFGYRGRTEGAEHEITIIDFSAIDQGGHEVINKDLKRRIEAELEEAKEERRDEVLGRAL